MCRWWVFTLFLYFVVLWGEVLIGWLCSMPCPRPCFLTSSSVLRAIVLKWHTPSKADRPSWTTPSSNMSIRSHRKSLKILHASHLQPTLPLPSIFPLPQPIPTEVPSLNFRFLPDPSKSDHISLKVQTAVLGNGPSPKNGSCARQ